MTADPNSVGKLADVLTVIPKGIDALRADVHAAEQARRRANALNTSLLLVAVLLVAVVGVVGWQVQSTNARIADCSTAGGRCYEEGRKRTDGAISAVVRISIFVSQCGRLWPGESGPEYDRKIEACVLGRLQQAVANPPGATPQPSTSQPSGLPSSVLPSSGGPSTTTGG